MRRYLRHNWGAPFILGFIFLLIASAAALSVGSADLANNVAVYAFYLLVGGVALQIASYVKYGDQLESDAVAAPPSPRPPRMGRRKMAALAVTAVVVVAGAGVAWYYATLPVVAPPQTISTTTGSASTSAPNTSSSSSTACAGSIFLSPVAPSKISVSVRIQGELFNASSGAGGGLELCYQAGPNTFAAPLGVGNYTFSYWEVIGLPSINGGAPAKLNASGTVVTIDLPPGLTYTSTVVIPAYVNG